MSDRPARFTIKIEIRDNMSDDVWSYITPTDEAMWIGWKPIEEMRLGVGGFDGAVDLMKVREFRRKLLVEIAKRSANAIADRLEDAEGWHDPDRIKPATLALKRYIP